MALRLRSLGVVAVVPVAALMGYSNGVAGPGQSGPPYKSAPPEPVVGGMTIDEEVAQQVPASLLSQPIIGSNVLPPSHF